MLTMAYHAREALVLAVMQQHPARVINPEGHDLPTLANAAYASFDEDDFAEIANAALSVAGDAERQAAAASEEIHRLLVDYTWLRPH